jgi:hypothetical protein
VKKVLLLTVVGILAVGVVPATGQVGQWTLSDAPGFVHDGVFNDSLSAVHGVVVDKYNRVWIGGYTPGGAHVFNADGTEAAFSSVDSVTVPFGTGDTTIHISMNTSCRGIGLANDGNILYTHKSDLIKINVDDGTGMAYFKGSHGSNSAPAQDAEGYIYLANVVPGGDPAAQTIRVLNPADLSLSQEITLENAPWCRAMEVTSDGTGIWLPNLLSSRKVYNYTTTDFVNYAMTADSIFTNTDGDTIIPAAISAMDWGPDGGLWLGGYGESGGNHLWRFDVTNMTYGVMATVDPGVYEYTDVRGVAFSATGDTMYGGAFDGGLVHRFVAGTPGSVRADRRIPEGYALSQNYPNPFNPTTEIRYEIGKMEPTSLMIYTIVGTEIRTLVNTVQPAGEYRVVWDGRDSKGLLLPSGIYVYRLRTGTVNLSKRMILIK